MSTTVVVGRLVGTFEPARVMVMIAQATSASARANTVAPNEAAGAVAGMSGKGMSQWSANPVSTASAHAIGGRTMTLAVSAVSTMPGPLICTRFDAAIRRLLDDTAHGRLSQLPCEHEIAR